MKLQLQRPIVFLDIESTGVDKDKDRIIELALCKLYPSGEREIKVRRFNPGIPIPASATEVHGISDQDVASEPSFGQTAKSLLEYLEGCDIGGYNSNTFDVPLLFREFLRAGHYWDYTKFRMVDACNIFKIQESRTLQAAVKFYCGKDLENAHSAQADIEATVDVFMAQLDRYNDIPRDLDELHLYCNYGKPIVDISGKFSTDEDGDIIFTFGKHRNEKAKNHLSFVSWMRYKADFSPDTNAVCDKLLKK